VDSKDYRNICSAAQCMVPMVLAEECPQASFFMDNLDKSCRAKPSLQIPRMVTEGVFCTIIDIRGDTCRSSYQVVSIKVVRPEHIDSVAGETHTYLQVSKRYQEMSLLQGRHLAELYHVVGGISNRVWAFSPPFLS
jgi:hypothetical protein